MASGWVWRYESLAGTPGEREPAVSQSFPTQSDAESWLGESWRELLDDGVEQVTLCEEDRVVYGPMSLRPPQ